MPDYDNNPMHGAGGGYSSGEGGELKFIVAVGATMFAAYCCPGLTLAVVPGLVIGGAIGGFIGNGIRERQLDDEIVAQRRAKGETQVENFSYTQPERDYVDSQPNNGLLVGALIGSAMIIAPMSYVLRDQIGKEVTECYDSFKKDAEYRRQWNSELNGETPEAKPTESKHSGAFRQSASDVAAMNAKGIFVWGQKSSAPAI